MLTYCIEADPDEERAHTLEECLVRAFYGVNGESAFVLDAKVVGVWYNGTCEKLALLKEMEINKI